MARRQGLPVWGVADSLAPSIALGTALGRVGCFLNGCCYGRPTKLPKPNNRGERRLTNCAKFSLRRIGKSAGCMMACASLASSDKR